MKENNKDSPAFIVLVAILGALVGIIAASITSALFWIAKATGMAFIGVPLPWIFGLVIAPGFGSISGVTGTLIGAKRCRGKEPPRSRGSLLTCALGYAVLASALAGLLLGILLSPIYGMF